MFARSRPRGTDIGDKALLNDKVSHVKRAIGAPTETHNALACPGVEEAVLDEEGREGLCNIGEVGCSIDLFLSTCVRSSERSRKGSGNKEGRD